MEFEAKERFYLRAILALGVLFSIAYIVTQLLVVDSMQVLERGYLFTQGHLIPFGPRSTNTNLIYGSFTSLFSGLALMINNHPYSVLSAILGFHLLGFYFLIKTQFLKQKKLFYLIYVFLFWCSPWRANEVFIWNPAFIITIATLYLYSIDLFLRKKDFLATLLNCLAIILCASLHNSFIFLGIISLGLWYYKIARPQWRAVGLSLVIAIIYLSPTIYTIISRPEVLDYNRSKGSAYLFKNLVYVGPAIKGILYWLRYPSLYFGSTIFAVSVFKDTFFEIPWNIIKWAFAIGSILAVLGSNIVFFKDKGIDAHLKKITFLAFISLCIVSSMSPVEFNYWHLYLIYPFCLIPPCYVLSHHVHKKKILLTVGVYFIFHVAVSSIGSEEHRFDSNMTEQYQKMLPSNQSLLEKYKLMIMP